MQVHFSSFTPETMRGFGQDLAADFHDRREFVDKTRNQMFTMLADSRREHCEAEAQRRQRAAGEADGRRLFMSEIRSGVHARAASSSADERWQRTSARWPATGVRPARRSATVPEGLGRDEARRPATTAGRRKGR
jgi:hypothetical protein